MKTLRSLLPLILLLVTALPSLGWTDPYKGYDETAFMEMDLEENLLNPAVAEKEHAAVSRRMRHIGTELARHGFVVDMMREDEVVLVTIPTDKLFLPNDTVLMADATKTLDPILKLLNEADQFKIVYAVHTDNTGSERYNMELSHARNGAIYDHMLSRVHSDLVIIPYEMGDTDPVESNDTRLGRAENRRLEIYLIPGPKMITDAHKGVLK
ncbi:MAG: OmpA family protein [Duncaniella sp.]|nr:OmpA family protein [Duncaniella sp.]